MAVTIVATVGSASANSYITLAAAETYIESRLNATLWDAASTDTKNRALVEACRYLSHQTWLGTRADDVQALAWPRQWCIDPDSPTANYYDTDQVPQRVKDANAELAFLFVKAGTTDVAALDPKTEIKREQIDVIATEYFEAHARPQGLARYPSVLRLIAPLLERVTPVVRVVRG